ncbi:uncharacterized protein EI97DRAFT_371601 [Westerdykella ornata]|uniref:Uncharacterized protein n=1 Tax=Westerdykella ornata TaxID=318751 RepID=A0A6A6JV85_WESOR|nr:uncharacterized protein EI97DRAFT_371601 [Westerdykella ornata]KAF2278949.1 hypothetical protein EI97DRAFT_371601 [Westerdykella ornata]
MASSGEREEAHLSDFTSTSTSNPVYLNNAAAAAAAASASAAAAAQQDVLLPSPDLLHLLRGRPDSLGLLHDPSSPQPLPASTPLSALSADNSDSASAQPSQPLPDPVTNLTTTTTPSLPPTPLQEHTHPDLSLAFAPALPSPPHASLPAPPIVKTAHNLRLPSFEALGIANPHPDRIQHRPLASFDHLGAGPLSKPEDPLHALSPPLARPLHHRGVASPDHHHPTTSPDLARPHLEHQISTVTPPDEPGTINWGSFVNVRTVGVRSPPRSDPGISPSINTVASSASPAVLDSAQDPLSVADLSDALVMAAWIDSIKILITSHFQTINADSVKVLSHALPCPSLTGHLFGQIIAGIHEKTTTPTAWINVFHALPGRYTLSDLPKSPPSTPGPAVGGEEYFTSKVFDSAVPVADYQLESKLLSPSPRPVVPPGSVNVSIVERYIPATNANEFAEMFKLQGRSLLYDRLIELSPHNGLLLFIYPTRTGARTFMSDYLGPVIDPLLRSVTVVHELSSDLGKSLGRMSAVESLVDYDTLHSEISRFCAALNERPNSLSAPSASHSPSPRATYTILHASREELVLDRRAWASDWWIKQEKPRVRELVMKYFRKKLPSSELTPTNLIQEILDGVAHREHPAMERQRPVELGVFVIRKTA